MVSGQPYEVNITAIPITHTHTRTQLSHLTQVTSVWSLESLSLMPTHTASPCSIAYPPPPPPCLLSNHCDVLMIKREENCRTSSYPLSRSPRTFFYPSPLMSVFLSYPLAPESHICSFIWNDIQPVQTHERCLCLLGLLPHPHCHSGSWGLSHKATEEEKWVRCVFSPCSKTPFFYLQHCESPRSRNDAEELRMNQNCGRAAAVNNISLFLPHSAAHAVWYNDEKCFIFILGLTCPSFLFFFFCCLERYPWFCVCVSVTLTTPVSVYWCCAQRCGICVMSCQWCTVPAELTGPRRSFCSSSWCCKQVYGVER